MKTIVIGDIHGLDVWKQIIKQEHDKCIFIGDYLDSFHVPGIDQWENLKDIIAYKKTNQDKVILLWGNHDHHYMNAGETYSGFQRGYQYQFGPLLEENKELFQICYADGNYLFSHAGITNTWMRGFFESFDVDKINELYRYKPRCFNFQGVDNYGNDITQDPLWVRPESLRKDRIQNYTHIIGHTIVPKVTTSSGMILIDCLETSGEYLEINSNKLIVRNTKQIQTNEQERN